VLAATTTGIALAVSVPASPSLISYTADISGFAGDSGNSTYNGMGTASDDAITSMAVVAATTTYMARLWGVLRNGVNAGNLQFRFATEVGGSAATIRAGAWGRAWTI
jgi:hypothetical protein